MADEERTTEPVDPRRRPKTAEAVAKGGDRPPEAPDGARPPLHEPYGRGSKAGSRLAQGEEAPATGPGAATDDPAPSPIPESTDTGERTTDPATIRRWAERHGGRPAAAANPEGRVGSVRIAFPDEPGSRPQGEIGWDEFFHELERERLALLYDPESRFHRLVGRDG